uniref:REJ domain-containing protein n=1 Tax=Caenorhabditis japonica TaxID=281687 RepID=A0A8R1DS73_CAEJA
MLKKLFFNIFVLIIFSEVCHCALLNQCYTSGTTCIRFEKGYFEFANTVQLTGDNVPTLKVNTSTSTRIVLSELLSHLVFNNSWTLAALVVNAGTRTNVQWKIAPDETSEHPIEIQDPAGYDSEFSNETVHCIDIQNYADDVKRVLVIPPSYRFFFSTIGTVSSCASNGLYLIPFVWDAQSRSRIRGMSYFSLSDCTDKCLVQPVPSLIVRFCPNMNNSDVKIRIDQVEDFTAVLSDDLLGINFQRVNKSLEFPIGIMDCTLFMENVELLGGSLFDFSQKRKINFVPENPICLGDGENIAVKFGSNPKIGVAQELKTRLSMRSAFLKNAKNAVYPNFTVSHEKKVATCSNLTKYEFEWKLNGEGQMYDDGLKLPAYSYSVDDKVNITLVARYNHEKTYSSSTTKTIHISASSYPPRALEVPVTFSVGDGWYDDKDDLPLSYQFGYKIYYGDNTTYEYWGSRSTVKAQQFFLPSTSGNSSEECGERVGITALLSVCDRLYSCSMKESTIFGIEPPENASLALMGIISSLNTDVANANFMSAIAKINVLNIELCTENYDQSQTDKITLLLFQSLTDSSESEEFQEALRASHSLLPVVSSDILTELIHVLSFYRRLTLESVSSATRMKRSIVEETSTKVYEATESEANDMLKVYDILIGKDKPVVDVFFLNINDFLTGFCVQLDENSGRVMSGTGDGYTTIQTQSINVNQEGYTGNFKISDPLELSNVTFLSYFATSYASWSCGNSLTSTCRHICLGTAWISQSAMADNSYLSDDLFLDQTDLSINKSVSDLHQISLVDPISGNMLTPSNGQFLYSVDMLVNNYKPINYYNCYLYSRNAGWLPRQCLSSLYAKTVSGQSFITCNCSATGIIGVFLANGPTPDPLPDHNEILLNFYIDLDVTADDLVKIFAKISTLAEVDQKYEHLYLNSNKFETLRRFVKISNRGNKIIQATLRPPFRVGQKSNSLAVQSIQKAVGYEKILNVITVLNFTYSAVERGRRNEIDFENKQFSDLSGDNNARKVTFNFAKSYLTQLGADADEYALKWAQSIATTLQISIYRLKNYKVFFGVVYNVTVTLPFTDEAKPLTAEEISLMIQECSKYGEFNFELPEESVQVVAINNSDIAMLLVMHETNSLMLAMVIVLSIVLGLGTIFICGAVLVKLRTDKLIVEERRRANLNENPFHLPPPPEYPVNSSPFQVVDQYR